MSFDSEIVPRAAAPPAPPAPSWIRALGIATLGLAAASLLCLALLFAQTAPAALAVPGAVLLALIALGCGIAAIRARRGASATSGGLDLLQQALAPAADAYLIVGRSDRAIHANPAFARCFPGLIGQPLDALQRRLVAGQGGTDDLAALRRDLALKGDVTGRIAIAPPAGSVARFDVEAHRLGGGSGWSLWRFAEAADRPVTTAARRAETPIREAPPAARDAPPDERFERFFANAPIGIGLLDRDGRFAAANAALGALLGATPTALIGKTLVSFLPDIERGAVAEKLAAASQADAPLAPVALRLAGKSASLVISRDGEGGLILHFIDTTGQTQLEVQFTQSQKMQAVGQLAGGVAHDFNNLLTAMIGFCDLLLQQHGPGDRSFPDIMQIKQNANRAANLVRQLLAFSRQQTLQPRILDITDALADLSHLLRRLIGENIELKVVHGRDLGLVKVDQGQLDQVIINLAVNARDAMVKTGGTLTIKTENVELKAPIRRGDEMMPPGRYVVIAVADTGTGIAKEILDRIFEPFFSTKEVGAGTGLGLSTVYGIVKQTDGFVLVDSEVGQGTTFSIYLPRHEGEAAERTSAARGSEEDGLPSDLTGAGTVLLVEDEDPVRLFSTRALKNKGYEVIEAESGEHALDILRDGERKVDLVITDVVMPKMDGPSLIAAVRELYPDRALKVIFISGYAEDNFRKNLGDDIDIHFLPKPFSLKQLAGKVKEVMKAPE
ncbi:MAG TPA: ATP-binding protein [Stellaceae bacterium]